MNPNKVKRRNSFKQRKRAFKEGKKLFYVDSLKRFTLGSSLEQCKSKLRGHENFIKEVSAFRYFTYILFGS